LKKGLAKAYRKESRRKNNLRNLWNKNKNATGENQHRKTVSKARMEKSWNMMNNRFIPAIPSSRKNSGKWNLNLDF
jgi:hypothetical protein